MVLIGINRYNLPALFDFAGKFYYALSTNAEECTAVTKV